jgi:hypothetical protein
VSPVVLMPILRHFRQVVAGRRLAAGDVQVLDRAPERVLHRRLELRKRHVALAFAMLPVVAHLALRVADPRAVVDEHRRPNRLQLGDDERIGQVARHAGRGLAQIAQGESAFRHSG